MLYRLCRGNRCYRCDCIVRIAQIDGVEIVQQGEVFYGQENLRNAIDICVIMWYNIVMKLWGYEVMRSKTGCPGKDLRAVKQSGECLAIGFAVKGGKGYGEWGAL